MGCWCDLGYIQQPSAIKNHFLSPKKSSFHDFSGKKFLVYSVHRPQDVNQALHFACKVLQTCFLCLQVPEKHRETKYLILWRVCFVQNVLKGQFLVKKVAKVAAENQPESSRRLILLCRKYEKQILWVILLLENIVMLHILLLARFAKKLRKNISDFSEILCIFEKNLQKSPTFFSKIYSPKKVRTRFF